MILDDLFEQKPLPAHIKPSDLPPAMRQRLSMKDIEAERPKGAYRYQVGDKQFLDLRSAQEFATGTGQRVIPISENANDPDVRRGMENVVAIERTRKTREPAIIDVGGQKFSISDPLDKEWFVKYIMGYINTGQADRIYKLMGNVQGFEAILDKFAEAHQAAIPADDSDLFATGQAGGPKAPRMQSESAPQKKRTDLGEAPASARTERMLAQMRARQPQASSDLEAMAYELQDAERRDAQEIDKLEKEVDDIETDIKQDLQKRISTLSRRRGGIRQASAQDTKIDSALDQLSRANDAQQREINNLERAVASLKQPIEPAKQAPASKLAAVATPTASKTVMPTPIGKQPEPPIEAPTPEPSADNGTDQPQLPLIPSDKKVVDLSQYKSAIQRARQAKMGNLPKTGTEDLEEGLGQWYAKEKGMAKSMLGTLGRAIAGKPGPMGSAMSTTTTAPKSITEPVAATNVAPPQDWKMGDPIVISGETITAKDKRYNVIAAQIKSALEKQQGLAEKKDRSPGKISKSEDPCWSGYHMVGTKKKGGRTVPNCVPGAKGAANESLREMSEQAALAKLRTREHPAFQMFVESWYRAHGGV